MRDFLEVELKFKSKLQEKDLNLKKKNFLNEWVMNERGYYQMECVFY